MALGPDSLTWKYAGDWRGMLLALWAGSMQNMHPGLGAAVEQHSQFFTERWERLNRSMYPIHGMVYDGLRADETAHEVRGYHSSIKGVDDLGRSYHALDPDTFFWAHSTFYMGAVLAAEYFMGGFSEAQRRTMYAEYVELYHQYGMSMRPVPATWEDFQVYWDRMCAEVLEVNKATRDVLDVARLPKPPALPWLPDAVWNLVRGQVGHGYLWLTTGLYPPAVRDLLGLTWTARDERRLRQVGNLINTAFRLVPPMRRYHPRARAGWRRVLGKDAADAPLVHAPARNLPPVEERSNPKHYAPAASAPRTSQAVRRR